MCVFVFGFFSAKATGYIKYVFGTKSFHKRVVGHERIRKTHTHTIKSLHTRQCINISCGESKAIEKTHTHIERGLV